MPYIFRAEFSEHLQVVSGVSLSCGVCRTNSHGSRPVNQVRRDSVIGHAHSNTVRPADVFLRITQS